MACCVPETLEQLEMGFQVLVSPGQAARADKGQWFHV